MKKVIKVIVILLILAIIAGFLYFLYLRYYQPSKLAETTTANPSTNQETTAASTLSPVKTIDFQETSNAVSQPIKEFSKDDLMRLAASFAERFGSYSNQSNFSNIKDLQIFMSQNMKNWAESFISSQRRKVSDSTNYYGIITKAVAQEVKEFDDDLGQASVLVKTRRREAIGSTNNVTQVFNQDILIDFVKEQGAWKVNKASWSGK